LPPPCGRSAEHNEAVVRFRQALFRRSDLTEAWFGLATCLQAIGLADDAIIAYRAILDADPNHAEAAFGWPLCWIGKPDFRNSTWVLEIMRRRDGHQARNRAA
jgi:Tfp pilus assembly protein PilF